MPDMVNVRKSHAGSDSAGHTWPTDGAVIEVPVEHALVLIRIPDGGFAIIETPPPDAALAPAREAEADAVDSDDVGPDKVAPRAQRAGRAS
jgi:hypothetical protein